MSTLFEGESDAEDTRLEMSLVGELFLFLPMAYGVFFLVLVLEIVFWSLYVSFSTTFTIPPVNEDSAHVSPTDRIFCGSLNSQNIQHVNRPKASRDRKPLDENQYPPRRYNNW